MTRVERFQVQLTSFVCGMSMPWWYNLFHAEFSLWLDFFCLAAHSYPRISFLNDYIYIYIYIYLCYLWRVDIKPHENISKQTHRNNLFFPSMWSIFCRFWANELEHNLRSITDYLSPSAGLKFADVLNGLAAISKVPAFWISKWLVLMVWVTFFRFFNHRLVASLILQPPPCCLFDSSTTASVWWSWALRWLNPTSSCLAGAST